MVSEVIPSQNLARQYDYSYLLQLENIDCENKSKKGVIHRIAGKHFPESLPGSYRDY